MTQDKSFILKVHPPVDQNVPAYWFVYSGKNLLVRPNGGNVDIPRYRNISELRVTPIRQLYLGTLDGTHCYALEVDENFENTLPDSAFRDLRELWELLDAELLELCGLAYQLLYWDKTTQFCGQCGAPLTFLDQLRAKECTECKLIVFPSIAPAIIVAVVKDNKLLLAHNRGHSGKMYSVVAGFLEPGETLEDCVRREVEEETGITVKNIRYFSSQPWPYPNSFMVGFTAEYAGGHIIPENDEIDDAGWYTADRLPRIPPKFTIARKLIDWFVEKQEKVKRR